MILALLRTLTPRAWAIIALIAALLLTGSCFYLSGRKAEREAQDARQAQAEVQASAGREKAASERENDLHAITTRQKERDDAAEALPDGAPDERELRRRCRQLRDAGRDPPACR